MDFIGFELGQEDVDDAYKWLKEEGLIQEVKNETSMGM